MNYDELKNWAILAMVAALAVLMTGAAVLVWIEVFKALFGKETKT